VGNLDLAGFYNILSGLSLFLRYAFLNCFDEWIHFGLPQKKKLKIFKQNRLLLRDFAF